MGFLPAGHGFEFICFLLETRWGVPMFAFLVSVIFCWFINGGWVSLLLCMVILPLVVLVTLVGLFYFLSQRDGGEKTEDWTQYMTFKDPNLTKQYSGKKIPIEEFYESYITEKLELKADGYEILLRRYQLFKFNFTLKYTVKFFMGTLLRQNIDHSVGGDNAEIAHVYDRGNDFYNWFLGETMVYTSGIFLDQDESLEVGQRRKLDTVCKQLQMKKGDQHLDLGCGWGTLLRHATKNFGTKSTGITLAKEQTKWHEQEAKKEGVNTDECKSMVLDYRKLPKSKKYNAITCLEMAEHVGIKNFQNFLLQVKDLLQDDGSFYLQIAGLRRTWYYEDLVWGIFMGKYIFPAADASCPLGWVVTQLERAGFEVHRVENCGVHYSLTIKKWYDNWIKHEKEVVAKYGQWWFRLWVIFLGWSAIIAAQGSSTVFNIVSTKNLCKDKMSVKNPADAKIGRMEKWVGPNVIATQQ